MLAFDLTGPGPSPRSREVIISADTAARQAAALGVSVALEIDLLLVHGLLHLAGYDDRDPDGGAADARARTRDPLESAPATAARVRLWAGLLPGR